MESGLTRAAAEFVAGLDAEAIPSRAIEAAGIGFTDCIGVMIAGSMEEPVEMVAAITSSGSARDHASTLR